MIADVGLNASLFAIVSTPPLTLTTLVLLVPESVVTPEFEAAGAKVRVVAVRRENSVVDVTIHEGRNRQVRKMFEALGHPVLLLTRMRFGPVALGDLAAGQTRPLSEKELSALERHRADGADGPTSSRDT